MSVSFRQRVEKLARAALYRPGTTAPALRQAIEARAAGLAGAPRKADATAAEVPADLESWVDKVACEAHRATDADVERLRQGGYSEDAIFEVTLAAALGAAQARYERGLELLREARP